MANEHLGPPAGLDSQARPLHGLAVCADDPALQTLVEGVDRFVKVRKLFWAVGIRAVSISFERQQGDR
jgi:hypothetical protein